MAQQPLQGSERESGPGKVEPFGWIEFTKDRREQLDVSLDEDGGITIEWTEKSDDCWGTALRTVLLGPAEFEQIIKERAAYLARRAEEAER